jgi:hypothetical protein
VHDSDDPVVPFGNDRELLLRGLLRATGPHLHAIGDDVTIEVSVGEGASVVTTPAVGMERCHSGSVAEGPTR